MAAAQATVSALQGRTLAIEAGQSALRQDLSAVAGNNVLALGPYLKVDTAGKPVATLSGINLQVVNGAGNTWTANGLGNLIIGYKETVGGLAHCSIGTDSAGVPVLDAAACAAASGNWGIGMRTGSHYVVIGSYHDYTATAGAVFGIGNVADAEGASVQGGRQQPCLGVVRDGDRRRHQQRPRHELDRRGRVPQRRLGPVRWRRGRVGQHLHG